MSVYNTQELQLLGYPPLVAVGGDKLDVICLINVVYDLMSQLKQFQSSNKETQDQSHKVLTDLQHCQWQLARQKELNVKRERETAELVEKERQMSVRLRQSQVELKKAREDIRQLTSDADLKQNQFQHALKRRDLENHRLNEQLIKLIRSKPVRSGGSSGGANVPLEFEIRGSLTAAPPLAGCSPRRKWDKAEDVRKPLEEKWRCALATAEREQRFLRDDYNDLVQLVVKLIHQSNNLLDCQADQHVFQAPLEQWIQLPMSMIRAEVNQLFQQLAERIDNQIKTRDRSDRAMVGSCLSTGDVPEELDPLQVEKQPLERAALDGHGQASLSKYLHLKESDSNVSLTASTTSAAVEFGRNWSHRPSEAAQSYRERSAAIPSGVRHEAVQLPSGPGLPSAYPHEPPTPSPPPRAPLAPLAPHPSIPVAEPLGRGEESMPQGTSGTIATGHGPWNGAKSKDPPATSADQQLIAFVSQNTILSKSVAITSVTRQPEVEADGLTASCASAAPPTGHLSPQLRSRSNSSSSSCSSGGSQKGGRSHKITADQFIRHWNTLEQERPQRAATQTNQTALHSLHGNASISAKVSFIQQAAPCDAPPTQVQPADQVAAGLSFKCRVTSQPIPPS